MKLVLNTRMIYEIIEENNPNKECKILILIDDRIADMLSNKKHQHIVTYLFITYRKQTFLLFLSYNIILLCQKILDYVLHTSLL